MEGNRKGKGRVDQRYDAKEDIRLDPQNVRYKSRSQASCRDPAQLHVGQVWPTIKQNPGQRICQRSGFSRAPGLNNSNKLYLHDYNKVLQYCKSYLK